jgi:hypothetical protein
MPDLYCACVGSSTLQRTTVRKHLFATKWQYIIFFVFPITQVHATPSDSVIKLRNRLLLNVTRSGFYKLSFHYFYINVISRKIGTGCSGLRKA